MRTCSAAVGEEKMPAWIQSTVAIKIPIIEAKDATLAEVVDFIAQRIAAIDSQPGGVSIFVEGNCVNKSDYVAKDVSVAQVFTDLATLYQVEFHLTDVGVIVTPVGTKPFPNVKALEGKIFAVYRSKTKADP